MACRPPCPPPARQRAVLRLDQAVACPGGPPGQLAGCSASAEGPRPAARRPGAGGARRATLRDEIAVGIDSHQGASSHAPRWSRRDLADWYRRWADVTDDPAARHERREWAAY